MTEPERALSQQLFGGQPSMGVMGALKEAFLAIAPGLQDAIPQAKAELVHQIGAGAHELAAALFNGHAFVMYQRGSKEDPPSHAPVQDSHDLQQDAPSQHLERGGRSM